MTENFTSAMNKSRLLIPSLVLLLTGCLKQNYHEDHRPISQSAMTECHHRVDWDEEKLQSALQGRWRWIYTEGYWSPENGHGTLNENKVICFRSDTTLAVFVDGQLQFSDHYALYKHKDGYFGIEPGLNVPELYGRILLCNNTLEFHDSYRDGIDNYFEKLE